MTKKRTEKLSDIGEGGIIKWLGSELGEDNIGDDASYLEFCGGYLILTTDMIKRSTHIPPKMSYEQIGKYIVTVNLSDVASMGAEPVAFLLSYASQRDFSFDNFREIIKGVANQCKKFHVRFAGGDTNEDENDLILAGSSIGFMKEMPVLRSGAKIGDFVCVTGKNLGAASYGLDLLKRKEKIKGYILKKTLEPEPRVEEGLFTGKYASSMTDISDSLATSLYDIALKSGVSIEINLSKLPEYDNTLDYALYGGGDYELLFTVDKRKIEKLRNEVSFKVIGKIVGSEENKVFGIKKNAKIKIEKKGYEHFS